MILIAANTSFALLALVQIYLATLRDSWSFKTDLIESVRIEREERKDSESSPLDDSIPANETTSVSTITIVNTSGDSQVDAYNENNQQ